MRYPYPMVRRKARLARRRSRPIFKLMMAIMEKQQ
jgi:hypothetical protein